MLRDRDAMSFRFGGSPAETPTESPERARADEPVRSSEESPLP